METLDLMGSQPELNEKELDTIFKCILPGQQSCRHLLSDWFHPMLQEAMNQKAMTNPFSQAAFARVLKSKLSDRQAKRRAAYVKAIIRVTSSVVLVFSFLLQILSVGSKHCIS